MIVPSIEYLDIFCASKRLSMRSRNCLPRYLTWFFDNVDLEKKIVIDIGGGTGLISFYAAEMGSKDVTCVEPLGDGSDSDMLEDFEMARRSCRNGMNVNLSNSTLEEFCSSNPKPADIVVLHNTINHLSEENCKKLSGSDPAAEQAYVEKMEMLASLVAPGGVLINADACQESFWNHIPATNPFAPTIDREIHQQPGRWSELFALSGFVEARTRWTPMLYVLTGMQLFSKNVSPQSFSAYYALGHFSTDYNLSKSTKLNHLD